MTTPTSTFTPKRILVPVDALSDDGIAMGQRAIDVAVTFAQASGGELVIATALPPPFPFVGIDVTRELEETVRAAETAKANHVDELLQNLRAGPERRGVKTSAEILAEIGPDAQRIVECAARVNADFIVITSHHRKGLERFFLGSVAEKVLHLAKVPVLLLPPQ